MTLLLLEGERIDGAPVEGIPALKLVIEVVLDVEVLGEVPNQVRYEQVLVVDEALNVGLTEFAFDVVATSVVEAVVMLVLVFKDDAEVEVLLELVVGGSGCCKKSQTCIRHGARRQSACECMGHAAIYNGATEGEVVEDGVVNDADVDTAVVDTVGVDRVIVGHWVVANGNP